MKSGFAKLFLLAAFVYAAFTVGELIMNVGQLQNLYIPSQDKIIQGSAYIMRWAIDPVFMCGTAVMVEFLERIWRELAKANDRQA